MCVGFTMEGFSDEFSETVHPHVRGVYWAAEESSRPLAGPPPRAWGLQELLGEVNPPSRSIPTYVGFT